MTERAPGILARAVGALGRTTDALVSVVDPIRGAQRLQARARTKAFQYLYGTGGYEGARHNRPATKGWNPKDHGPTGALIPDLETLRSRSYDLERNAPLARAVTNTYKSRVVGPGLWPRPKLDHVFLGISEEEASEISETAERYFWTIAMSGTLDYENNLPWTSMVKLVLGSWLTGGDVFAVRRFDDSAASATIGTKVQLIEAGRVCNPTHEPQRVEFADGVERNSRGQPVAIHVCDVHPGELGVFGARGAGEWKRVPLVNEELGERQVLHIFEPLRIGQPRGEPIFAPVIEYLKQLKRMSDAELQAAVLNAYFTVIVTSPTGDVTLGDMEQAGQPKPTATADSTMGSDIELGSGTVAYAAEGESIQFADPKRPNPNVDAFVRAFTGYVGAATGIPREVLLKEFTASYSAARAALLDMFAAVIEKRTVLTDLFCQPVYEWVLSELVDRGLVRMPGFHDSPIVRQAWCEAEWHGPTMGSIDPVDDIDAADRRMRANVSTLEAETAQLTGGDWAANLKQRAREMRVIREAGLDVEMTAERIRTEPMTPQDGGDIETPPPAPRRVVPPEARHRLRGDARDAAELAARRIR